MDSLLQIGHRLLAVLDATDARVGVAGGAAAAPASTSDTGVTAGTSVQVGDGNASRANASSADGFDAGAKSSVGAGVEAAAVGGDTNACTHGGRSSLVVAAAASPGVGVGGFGGAGDVKACNVDMELERTKRETHMLRRKLLPILLRLAADDDWQAREFFFLILALLHSFQFRNFAEKDVEKM